MNTRDIEGRRIEKEHGLSNTNITGSIWRKEGWVGQETRSLKTWEVINVKVIRIRIPEPHKENKQTNKQAKLDEYDSKSGI